MPRNNQNDNDPSSSQPQVQNKGGRPIVYLLVALVVIALIAIVYYELSSPGNQNLNNSQTLNSVSNSSLNQTQRLFIDDLKRSENANALHVTYYSRNATQNVTESANLTVSINSNLTIDSYKLGEYNRSVYTTVVSYTNAKTGQAIAKNVSALYYYDTNTVVTCINGTTYASGLLVNSSFMCGNGDQGMSYLESTPFTAANVSTLSYLVFNNSVTYKGAKTIEGRSCDDFIISNATAANLQSNFTTFNFCIDTQYGIPLYFNETDVSGGIPSTFTLTATQVSENVSSSDFIIPQAYLNSISKSVI